MPTYEPVIGLEVHAQLLTKSKAFCGCSAAFGAPPNTAVCPVCLGLPGSLPVLNGGAVTLAVRAALALGAEVREDSSFARKHYFYADQPKGYQISQFDEPFSVGGHLDASGKRVRITRVHMEEDAGKTLHTTGEDSIVDLNRSGVPLIEIVGEPDLRSGAEAAAYLRALREILVFIGVNDGQLEEGSFRCDANVSVRPVGQTKLGTRVELKNINSMRFVEKAIDYEISRQVEEVEAGRPLVQETRGWDERRGTTYSLRSKEEADDYRYFPDPDLPRLVLSRAFVGDVARTMPELPAAKRRRFVERLGVTEAAAEVLTQHPDVAALFEETARLSGDAPKSAAFIQTEVLRDVEWAGGAKARLPVTAEAVAGILALVKAETISGKQAKELYARVRDAAAEGAPAAPVEVARRLGMTQESDDGALLAACEAVVLANARQVAAYRSGKTALLGYFVGLVMKETRGRANPAKVNAILQKLLGSS